MYLYVHYTRYICTYRRYKIHMYGCIVDYGIHIYVSMYVCTYVCTYVYTYVTHVCIQYSQTSVIHTPYIQFPHPQLQLVCNVSTCTYACMDTSLIKFPQYIQKGTCMKQMCVVKWGLTVYVYVSTYVHINVSN